jgi:cysteine desulfurase family protein (TIGR01976 family)
MMAFDIQHWRSLFPALTSGQVFLDNPGGTQIARPALDRMQRYLVETNANRGGAFPTSRQSDAVLDNARQAMATFVNASRPDEIVFGPNMTSLTLAASRSLATRLIPDDEIVVTRLDHDANVSPWLQAAEASGARVRWADFDVEDCRLRMDDLLALIGPRTRLVAVGFASNAVGTINDVARVAAAAHQVGALCYVDAVQLAPHRAIDVQALDCDFLALSVYKLFGPHAGALYGRFELLDELPAFNVRPASQRAPRKFETGTQNHEGIAGTLGALEYIAQIGHSHEPTRAIEATGADDNLRPALKHGMRAIEAYERPLTARLVEGLQALPGVRIFGLTEPEDLAERVPTVSIRIEGHAPQRVAHQLGERGIYVWDGNFYAPSVTERLGLEQSGGLIRLGLAHYNTAEEVDFLLENLEHIAKQGA